MIIKKIPGYPGTAARGEALTRSHEPKMCECASAEGLVRQHAIARTAQAVRASTTPLIKVQCNGAWWAGMEELFDECVRLRPRRRGAELYH